MLAVLDEQARSPARQVAADEIFVGRRPVLMTVEQDSLCWLGGRLAESRDGDEWAKEFQTLPAVEQVTRDGGQGMQKGLAVLNEQREQAGLPPVADQEDHFPILHRARRGIREVKAKAVRAFRKAEKAQAKMRRDRRRGKLPGGQGAWVARCCRQAEQALDRWSAPERSVERLRAGLVLSREAGARARFLVRGVLVGAWRSSSLGEGLNSVLRMQQSRQKRMTQGLLDLKRLYWNGHQFVAGKQKGTNPSQRLGVRLPQGSWWQLLKKSPEQLRNELSARGQAA